MKKSFTLIEILVVIAIVGALAALLLPNFMAARERGRDSQRKNDLKQLQKALELYRQDQTPPAFPTPYGGNPSNGLGTCGGQFAKGTVIYMNKIPCDPLGPTPYFYNPNNSQLTYNLCACLENKADADANDSNCRETIDGQVGYECPSGKSYSLQQP